MSAPGERRLRLSLSRSAPRRAVLWLGASAIAGIVVVGFSHSEPTPVVTFALAVDRSANATSGHSRDWRAEGRLARIAAGGSIETFRPWLLAGSPDVAFDGRRVLFAGRRPPEPVAQIWEMDVNGRAQRRLVNCSQGCATPRYLADGRIVFTQSTGSDGTEALFTAARDGSGLGRITFGHARDRADRVLDDGRIAFTRELIEHSSRPTKLLHLTINPDGTGIATAPASVALPGASLPLIGRTSGPRRAPPIATSVVDPSRQTGWLLCLDAWLTEHDGRPQRRPETSNRIRVIDASSNTVLGEAPLAPDGSFYVEVPADRLLRLAALDQTGAVVAALDSGIWVRPNEHRGCIGCHEPGYLAPQNQFPLALRGRPAAMLGHSQSARAGALMGGLHD